MAKNIVTLNLDSTDYSIRPYGTCSTAAATAAKTVDINGFTLCTGATVLVKFNNANSATSPTLNINSSGAKSIKWKGVSNNFLDANVYYEFIYDGTNWVVLGEADTKNTAGSTNSASKMFLIGATSQAANPQTHSNSKIYATDGVLTTEGGINLYKSTGDSPALTFLRGTTTDTLTDWRMFVDGGVFKIQNQLSGEGWKDVLSLANPGTLAITSSYNIIPSANGTLDLGSSSNNWRNIYGTLKGNAETATTATNVTNVYESKIKWGNTNIAAGLSPVDVAMGGQWSANRLSFMPADDILVEYFKDGGDGWEDYGLTDAEKRSLVTTGLTHTIRPGKNSVQQKTTDQVRVTITAAAGNTYFSLKKIYIYLSTNGATGTKVKIEKSMCGSDTTFVDVGDYSVSGWSGWNSIPLIASFGGGDTQTSNVRRIRLTFYFTGYASGYGEATTDKKVLFSISNISMHGETSWQNKGGSFPTTGHMYSYDINKNVTFPASLKAITIYENGTALSSKYALQKATSDNFGGIKLGYSQSGKNYPVQLSSDNKAYVNVPWTDNNDKVTTVGNHYKPNNTDQTKSSGLYKITTDAAGHVTNAVAVVKSDITGLGIPSENTVYTHPTSPAGAKSSGLYKIATDAAGHVTNAIAVVKSDITGLGIPEKDTTYSNATTSKAGLMSTTDKSKLDNIVAATNSEIDDLF